MSILDHPLIGERYFFPRDGHLPEPFLVDVADGVTLACARPAAGGNGPTCLYFHGNGEVVADLLPDFAEAITRAGAAPAFFEYRGYGASTGEPRLVAMLDDVEAVIEALGVPDERLVFFGRSVGSIYAIEAVRRRPRAAGLILESSIADVLERILLRIGPEEIGVTGAELEVEVREFFDHEAKLGAFSGPVLVLHCAGDRTVDQSHGRRNHDWAGGERRRLVIFPQGDHNSILALNWQEYWDEVSHFLHGAVAPSL